MDHNTSNSIDQGNPDYWRRQHHNAVKALELLEGEHEIEMRNDREKIQRLEREKQEQTKELRSYQSSVRYLQRHADMLRTRRIDSRGAEQYVAVMEERDGWWLGWVEGFPDIHCQERTRDDLLESLNKAFAKALPFKDGAMRTLLITRR